MDCGALLCSRGVLWTVVRWSRALCCRGVFCAGVETCTVARWGDAKPRNEMFA